MTNHHQTTNGHRPVTHLVWLVAISLAVFGIVWLTLYQIRTIAIDRGPTAGEVAECRAALSPDEAVEWTERCETEPHIIWVARHPLRNSLALLVLLLVVGYAALDLNRRYRSPIPYG